MNRFIVGLLGTVLAAGCGGDGGEPTVSTTSPGVPATSTASPSPTGFASTEFEPAVSFEAGEAWIVEELAPNLIFLDHGNPPGMVILKPQYVFDPKTQATIDPPKDLIAWLQSNQWLDAKKPVQVTVGGASGIQLDARVRSAPESTPIACPAPECVLLFSRSIGFQVNVYKGEMVRVVVLDVNGETVVIEMDAPARRWEAFLAEAEEVLATLQFG